MAFKNLRLSYNKMMLGLRRYLLRGGNERIASAAGYGKIRRRRRRRKKKKKEPRMMTPVSHGYHVVVVEHSNSNNSSIFDGEPRELGTDESDDGDDKVVAQREEIEEHELWFFGVFDSRTGDGVSKYMQTHLFDKKMKIKEMRSRSKEAMRMAHLNARTEMRDAEKVDDDDDDDSWEMGSASAVIIDGEKMVVADMGEYKVVVCRDGKAYQINRRLQQQPHIWHWSRTFIPGALRKIKLRFKGRDSRYAKGVKTDKTSEVAVGYETVYSDTQFMILASIGIWEVMKYQEAVNLIRHIEDPQEAAECLAKEALIRMTKKNISCLIIRFA